MNKQELIKKYKRLEGVWDAPGAEIARQIFPQDLEQLDEPQKPVVPQFVADWYEENKTNLEYNIWEYIYNWDKQNISQIKIWFDYSSNKPLQTLINMKQFGYEVEEEKRYIIKLKGVPDGAKFLKYAKVTQEWYFGMKGFYSDREIIHTRKELEEANFGWVFSCEGIEIEEVTE